MQERLQTLRAEQAHHDAAQCTFRPTINPPTGLMGRPVSAQVGQEALQCCQGPALRNWPQCSLRQLSAVYLAQPPSCTLSTLEDTAADVFNKH